MKEVLLVEMSRSLLASRLRTLEAEGYQVTSVSTAAEAAKVIRHGSCDLIIADAGVPEVLEVLASSVVPALVMADEEKIESVVRELPMGIWALLVKPFTAARLKHAVAEAIERADTVKDVIQQRVLLPLNNSSKLLISEAEIDRFFRHILEMTAAETEADGAAVLILDERSRELTVKASLGIKPGTSEAYIKLGDWVMKMAKSLVVNERREAEPYVKQVMSDLGLSSLLAVPLLNREEAIGAIGAFKIGKGSRFTPTSLEFLSILAKQAATVVEDANLFKGVERQRQKLETLLERAIESQENERKRVAVEIHDGIGQQLVGALYRVQAFGLLLTQQKFDEVQAEAEEIKHLLENILRELRRILAGLHAHVLDELGLISALRQEANKLNEETGTSCHFRVEGTPIGLSSSREAAIYRIVQEALTNIRRHANATEANILVHFESGTVSVKVSDNGKGFKLDQANNGILRGHRGLLGMKERAEMAGGNLSVTTEPGRGTSITLTFPAKP